MEFSFDASGPRRDNGTAIDDLHTAFSAATPFLCAAQA
jgi:hypothetical protein